MHLGAKEGRIPIYEQDFENLVTRARASKLSFVGKLRLAPELALEGEPVGREGLPLRFGRRMG